MITASILGADLLNLEKEINLLISNGIKKIHFDVMDGHFVNNITFGCDLLKIVKQKFPNITIDTHLMVSNPQEHIANFLDNGSDLISWHAELNIDHQQLINLTRSRNKSCGLAINPNTEISSIDPDILKKIDFALIMTVVPGKCGQVLISECLDKMVEIKNINPQCMFFVDGGVNDENVKFVYQKGADVVVSGSFLFKNIAENSLKLKRT